MTRETFEPMEQVKRTLRIDWYRTPVKKAELRRLTKRSNFRGLTQSLGWLALVTATGTSVWLAWAGGQWVAFAVALFVHGTIYSFNRGIVTHELSHGTVFRSKWLNWIFLRLFCLLAIENHHHYKRSHTYHHLFTLYPQGDREVTLPRNPTIGLFRWLWLLTLNIPLLWHHLYHSTLRLAFAGKLEERGEWSDAVFPQEDRHARMLARRWAWLLVAFHGSLVVLGALSGLWQPVVLVTVSNFIANWWRYIVGFTMHAGLRDETPDFRKCCRSITLDPLSRFIYWHMNYHTEHHMYAAVPCYRLRGLAKAIAYDLPQPRSVLEAWREMRETYRRQQTDPEYQFDTPIPGSGGSKETY